MGTAGYVGPSQIHQLEPLLVTLSEAAKLLRLSQRTVWQLAKDGEIGTVRQGRAVRYVLASLRAWVEQRQRDSQPTTSAPAPGICLAGSGHDYAGGMQIDGDSLEDQAPCGLR